MKYLKVVLLSMLLIVFVIGMVSLSKNNGTVIQNADYLRLHIRANSNSECDQNIKYEIKNQLLALITKDVANNQNKTKLENFVNNILKANNFNYISNITIKNEYFPTRTYNNVTLTSGFYDAIIVELGTASGNNWWCVAYPPLCFMYESENYGKITYKSKLLEIINNFFKR